MVTFWEKLAADEDQELKEQFFQYVEDNLEPDEYGMPAWVQKNPELQGLERRPFYDTREHEIRDLARGFSQEHGVSVGPYEAADWISESAEEDDSPWAGYWKSKQDSFYKMLDQSAERLVPETAGGWKDVTNDEEARSYLERYRDEVPNYYRGLEVPEQYQTQYQRVNEALDNFETFDPSVGIPGVIAPKREYDEEVEKRGKEFGSFLNRTLQDDRAGSERLSPKERAMGVLREPEYAQEYLDMFNQRGRRKKGEEDFTIDDVFNLSDQSTSFPYYDSERWPEIRQNAYEYFYPQDESEGTDLFEGVDMEPEESEEFLGEGEAFLGEGEFLEPYQEDDTSKQSRKSTAMGSRSYTPQRESTMTRRVAGRGMWLKDGFDPEVLNYTLEGRILGQAELIDGSYTVTDLTGEMGRRVGQAEDLDLAEQLLLSSIGISSSGYDNDEDDFLHASRTSGREFPTLEEVYSEDVRWALNDADFYDSLAKKYPKTDDGDHPAFGLTNNEIEREYHSYRNDDVSYFKEFRARHLGGRVRRYPRVGERRKTSSGLEGVYQTINEALSSGGSAYVDEALNQAETALSEAGGEDAYFVEMMKKDPASQDKMGLLEVYSDYLSDIVGGGSRKTASGRKGRRYPKVASEGGFFEGKTYADVPTWSPTMLLEMTPRQLRESLEENYGDGPYPSIEELYQAVYSKFHAYEDMVSAYSTIRGFQGRGGMGETEELIEQSLDNVEVATEGVASWPTSVVKKALEYGPDEGPVGALKKSKDRALEISRVRGLKEEGRWEYKRDQKGKPTPEEMPILPDQVQMGENLGPEPGKPFQGIDPYMEFQRVKPRGEPERWIGESEGFRVEYMPREGGYVHITTPQGEVRFLAGNMTPRKMKDTVERLIESPSLSSHNMSGLSIDTEGFDSYQELRDHIESLGVEDYFVDGVARGAVQVLSKEEQDQFLGDDLYTVFGKGRPRYVDMEPGASAGGNTLYENEDGFFFKTIEDGKGGEEYQLISPENETLDLSVGRFQFYPLLDLFKGRDYEGLLAELGELNDTTQVQGFLNGSEERQGTPELQTPEEKPKAPEEKTKTPEEKTQAPSSGGGDGSTGLSTGDEVSGTNSDGEEISGAITGWSFGRPTIDGRVVYDPQKQGKESKMKTSGWDDEFAEDERVFYRFAVYTRFEDSDEGYEIDKESFTEWLEDRFRMSLPEIAGREEEYYQAYTTEWPQDTLSLEDIRDWVQGEAMGEEDPWESGPPRWDSATWG